MVSTKLTLDSLADLLVEAKQKGVPSDVPVVLVVREPDGIERRADTVVYTQYDVMADAPQLEVFVREESRVVGYDALGRVR